MSRSSVILAVLPISRSSASGTSSAIPSRRICVKPRPTRRRKVIMCAGGREGGRRFLFLGSWGRRGVRVERCGLGHRSISLVGRLGTGLWGWCLSGVEKVHVGRSGSAFAVLSERLWRGEWGSEGLAGTSSSSPWFVVGQSLPKPVHGDPRVLECYWCLCSLFSQSIC